MGLTVINGGVRPGEPAPIVWNRQPIDAQRVALVLRDAHLDGDRSRMSLAWDDGRPFLIGIRDLRLPAGAAALEAWKALAVLIGAEIRDERRDPDVFAEADANNARAAAAARLETARRAKESRRGCEPMAAGSLFDDVARNQRGLDL